MASGIGSVTTPVALSSTISSGVPASLQENRMRKPDAPRQKDVIIRSIGPGESEHCESVLRSVPEWFGIEAALLRYVNDTQVHPTWIAWATSPEADPETDVTSSTSPITFPAGFVTIRSHYPQSAEINCLAVHRDFHRCGIGRMLMTHAEREIRASGVRFLQVKTMGPSKPNAEYAQTRLFYLSIGYTELEEFIGLWNGLPALQLVKSL